LGKSVLLDHLILVGQHRRFEQQTGIGEIFSFCGLILSKISKRSLRIARLFHNEHGLPALLQ